MDFKKLMGEAKTTFQRAVQFTEEHLGTSERTQLDASQEALLQQADSTKARTERLVASMECMLQPNPNVRMEDFVYEKLDKRKRDRTTNVDKLGQAMIDAGNELGSGTSYGRALVQVGEAQKKLGQEQRELVHATAAAFLTPLKNFLEGDLKTLQKERKLLEAKRLDLDLYKNKHRKAKSARSQEQTEQELRVAQAEYDRQCEVTKLLLHGVHSSQAHHLKCLSLFVEAQSNYHAQCHEHMQDLHKLLLSELADEANGGVQEAAKAGGKRARVLYDYDAADKEEMSLVADELITVYHVEGDPDWRIGERGQQKGKVPLTYIEVLN